MVSQITEEQLGKLVAQFYARVRRDPVIGPVFNQAVDDWDEHLTKLTAFWSSIMLGTGRYKGNPMAAHMKHHAFIKPEMFDRWLALWAEVTHENFDAAVANRFQEKAARIAESLKLGLEINPRLMARSANNSAGE